MIKKKIIRYIKQEIDEDSYIPPSYWINNTHTKKNVSLSTKKELLDQLEKKVKGCKNCPLGLTRTMAVFGVGNPEAEVMFIGEGPGWEEDHKGEPFVGKAGQLLDKILQSINLSRETVYIANIVKCHPMINPQTPDARGNDRPPTDEEISKCRTYIEEQIRIIKPKYIVTLGNTATKFMLNEKKGVSSLRGKVYDLPMSFFFDFELKIIPTYHPAALLRNPNLKKETWQDMKMLRDLLKK